MPSLLEAKNRLDEIIAKARIDLYKPIHIAEVLYRHRTKRDINVSELSTFQNPSLKWRDEVTIRLMGKKSTSSARYQHDVWNSTAMPPELLALLAQENSKTRGAVECYIYNKYVQRQSSVGALVSLVNQATPDRFDLRELLDLFQSDAGMRRSVDKAYEIVTYALLETFVTGLRAEITVSIPDESVPLLVDFEDLASLLLGISGQNRTFSQLAHLFRVGVTNAADRGLDMWANFGPAVQVKHLTVNPQLANAIVDQVESDSIIIVCIDAEKSVIEAITKQIGWGRRVRGIITKEQLILYYDRALRGSHSEVLGIRLLESLLKGFLAEFPQLSTVEDFLSERGYIEMNKSLVGIWKG